eukprot:2905937-Prymnesium_polylepis.1
MRSSRTTRRAMTPRRRARRRRRTMRTANEAVRCHDCVEQMRGEGWEVGAVGVGDEFVADEGKLTTNMRATRSAARGRARARRT